MLDKLKLMLGFTEDDDRDELLEHIIELTTARLKRKLGGVEAVPEELGYIVQPHTSAGRIPSDKGYRLYVDTMMQSRMQEVEGLPSHTVEGESLTFADSDFDAFKEDIQDYLNSKDENPKKGGFKFL